MLDLNGKKLVLASASPRRAELLRRVGFEFEVVDSAVNEAEENYTIPEVHVLELSRKKAETVAKGIEDGLIVGADTIVVLDNEILGKPKDADDARNMLQRLSGRTHTVYTGFALIDRPSGEILTEYEKTDVTFRELDEKEIETYIQTDSPFDKAGAYGIQDLSAIFVTKVDGCFYNVVGFPLTRFFVSARGFLNHTTRE